jgi:hypothetical protein
MLEAHEGFNNFFNEAEPTRALLNMGSVIPVPAIQTCMSAILAVKLGNMYGPAFAAQPYVDELLQRLNRDRWRYFLNECLPTDERILYKFFETGPRERWYSVFVDYALQEFLDAGVIKREVSDLLVSTSQRRNARVMAAASGLLVKLGYKPR